MIQCAMHQLLPTSADSKISEHGDVVSVSRIWSHKPLLTQSRHTHPLPYPGLQWNSSESDGRQEVLIVLVSRSRSQTAYRSDVTPGRARHIFVLAHRVTKKQINTVTLIGL